jgi:hypothetical protein|tara:strand:- start:36 stop:302 length:267 start_codon:yes stop_codon:yes gene_type:complete
MIKNIFSVLIFLFSVLFFFLVVDTYFSDYQKKKILKKREEVSRNINANIVGLPILVNDTNDVIVFNSGFENNDKTIERNFWKLFKNND